MTRLPLGDILVTPMIVMARSPDDRILRVVMITMDHNLLEMTLGMIDTQGLVATLVFDFDPPVSAVDGREFRRR